MNTKEKKEEKVTKKTSHPGSCASGHEPTCLIEPEGTCRCVSHHRDGNM